MNRLWVRLTLAFVLVTLVGAGLVALLTDWSASNQFRQYVGRQEMLTQSGLLDDLATWYAQNGTWNGVATLLANSAGIGGMGRGRGMQRGRPSLIFADGAGTVLYDENGGATLNRALTADERSSAQPVMVAGQTVGYLTASGGDRSTLSPQAQDFLDQLRNTLLLAAAVAGVVGVTLGLVISWTLAAPLAQLAGTARAIAARQWDRRAPVRGADEMAAVARAFNDMADELQRAEILRRNLTADIAHELRTPLTVMQGNLGAMLDGVYPLDHREIATLYNETRILSRLVDDLRELALADAGQLPLRVETVQLSQALEAVAAHLAEAARAAEVSLGVEAVPLYVQADADRLNQIILNLVSNALRHTPRGGVITLRAEACTTSPERVRISVIDSGEGIPPVEVSHVFERFYRGDKSRARDRGGSGLGLAIAQAWVRAMGGEIGVESVLGKGSTFWFLLPRTAGTEHAV